MATETFDQRFKRLTSDMLMIDLCQTVGIEIRDLMKIRSGQHVDIPAAGLKRLCQEQGLDYQSFMRGFNDPWSAEIPGATEADEAQAPLEEVHASGRTRFPEETERNSEAPRELAGRNSTATVRRAEIDAPSTVASTAASVASRLRAAVAAAAATLKPPEQPVSEDDFIQMRPIAVGKTTERPQENVEKLERSSRGERSPLIFDHSPTASETKAPTSVRIDAPPGEIIRPTARRPNEPTLTTAPPPAAHRPVEPLTTVATTTAGQNASVIDRSRKAPTVPPTLGTVASSPASTSPSASTRSNDPLTSGGASAEVDPSGPIDPFAPISSIVRSAQPIVEFSAPPVTDQTSAADTDLHRSMPTRPEALRAVPSAAHPDLPDRTAAQPPIKTENFTAPPPRPQSVTQSRETRASDYHGTRDGSIVETILAEVLTLRREVGELSVNVDRLLRR